MPPRGKASVSFAERAKLASKPTGQKCQTCKFLASLPAEYRTDVVEAFACEEVSTKTLMALLAEDGHEYVYGDSALGRHRRGECNAAFRREQLGDADGVIPRKGS